MNRGDVFVISAPSGSGKTTVCRMLVERVENVEISVSYTTRGRKAGEVEGKDYHFIDAQKFDKMVVSREFLEFASVYGNRYGTSRKAVEEILLRGTDALLEIDEQGGRAVKREIPGAVRVALFPPDWRTLEDRLTGRGRDSAAEMEARLRAAAGEAQGLLAYDYLVVNDDLESTVARVEWIVRASRLRRKRAIARMEKILRESGEGEPWRE